MISVIRTGGKQYIVQPGTKLKVEKIDKPEGEEITLTDVLLLEDNGVVEIGKPVVDKAKVQAKILKHGKGEKIIVFKYKPKKRYKRKIGHRQQFTEIEILSIKK